MRRVTLVALLVCWKNEREILQHKLGQLVSMAYACGDAQQLEILGLIVEIDDAATGQVRLKPRAGIAR